MEPPGQTFRIGQKVFAKIKGYPPWPAKVIRTDKAPKRKYKVLFYGSYTSSEVKAHQMFCFQEHIEKLRNVNTKKRPAFLRALKEAEEDKTALGGVRAQKILSVKEETQDDSEWETIEVRQDAGTQSPNPGSTESVPATVKLEANSVDAFPALETDPELILESSPPLSVPEPTPEPSSSSEPVHDIVEEAVNIADVPDAIEEVTLAADHSTNHTETACPTIAAVITNVSEVDDPSNLQYLGSFEVPPAKKFESDDEDEDEEDSDESEVEVTAEISGSLKEVVPREEIVVDIGEDGEPKVSKVISTKPLPVENPRSAEPVVPLEEPEFVDISSDRSDDERDSPKEVEDVSLFHQKVENELEKTGGDEVLSINLLTSSSEDEAEQETGVNNDGNGSTSRQSEIDNIQKESSPTALKRKSVSSGENESSSVKRTRVEEKDPIFVDKPVVKNGEKSDVSPNVTVRRAVKPSVNLIGSDGETSPNINTRTHLPLVLPTKRNTSKSKAQAPEATNGEIGSRPNDAERDEDSDSGSELGQGAASNTVGRKNFLHEEGKMVKIESEIRRALSTKDPRLIEALAYLDDLSVLNIKALMLKKHPILIDTIRKLRRYVGPPDTPGITFEKRLFNIRKSRKIRKKADDILEKQIKPLFKRPPVGVSFWDLFYDTLERFRSATSTLTENQIAMYSRAVLSHKAGIQLLYAESCGKCSDYCFLKVSAGDSYVYSDVRMKVLCESYKCGS